MDSRRASIADDVSVGARAGVLGTLAMSALMLVAQRAGFRHAEQPPKRIVEHFLDVGGIRRRASVDNTVATVLHVGYGALLGIGYRALRRRTRLPGPAVLHGAFYGLAVWAANYAGWLPSADVMPPPQRDVKPRRATMIAAHLLFGGVLGMAGDPVRGRTAVEPRATGRKRPRGGDTPVSAPSTGAVAGGGTVTTPQDVEPGPGAVADDHTVTRPVDIEGGDEGVFDDHTVTRPIDLERDERRRSTRRSR